MWGPGVGYLESIMFSELDPARDRYIASRNNASEVLAFNFEDIDDVNDVTLNAEPALSEKESHIQETNENVGKLADLFKTTGVKSGKRAERMARNLFEKDAPNGEDGNELKVKNFEVTKGLGVVEMTYTINKKSFKRIATGPKPSLDDTTDADADADANRKATKKLLSAWEHENYTVTSKNAGEIRLARAEVLVGKAEKRLAKLKRKSADKKEYRDLAIQINELVMIVYRLNISEKNNIIAKLGTVYKDTNPNIIIPDNTSVNVAAADRTKNANA